MIFLDSDVKKRVSFDFQNLCALSCEDVVLEKAKLVALTGTLPKTSMFAPKKLRVFSQESPNFQGAPILRGKLAVSFREGISLTYISWKTVQTQMIYVYQCLQNP